MSPPSPKVKYKQYKSDTNVVAQWLADTANGHGYKPAAPAQPLDLSGRRSTGQTRRSPKARIMKSIPVSPALGHEETIIQKPQYIIARKEFEPMAMFIVQLPNLQIPDYFITAIERAIEGREKKLFRSDDGEILNKVLVRANFSACLRSNGVTVDRASDSQHSHFIRILEKVRDHLQPYMKQSAYNANRSAKATTSKDSGVLRNMFGVLDVYTTRTEPPSPSETSRRPEPDKQYVAEEENTFLEAFFVFTVLLDDYDRLRSEVAALWAEFAAGTLDLAAVSIATNMATEIAQSMEGDVAQVLHNFGGSASFAHAYFATLCKASGIAVENKERPDDPYNLEAYELADPCMINTMTMIVAYIRATDFETTNLQTYNGSLGWYDEKVGASGQSNRQKWEQDKTALAELFPDLACLISRMDRYPIMDELTRGLVHLIATRAGPKDVPIWLAWATQLYLDILQALGESCGCGLFKLQEESLRIKKSMTGVPPSTEHSNVMKAAGIWDEDPIWTARKAGVEAGEIPDTMPPQFQLLRRNPMHCGLILHDMCATFHSAGLLYAAASGALLSATHLYHALSHEGLIDSQSRWDDLDALWKMQGNDSFFCGNPPTTRDGYFTNYCLSIGSSARNWASNKRKGRLQIRKDNRRALKPMAYLSLSVNNRLQHGGKRPPLSPTSIERLLQEGAKKRGNVGKKKKGKTKRGHATSKNELSAGHIWKVAVDIQHEIPAISFNLFVMHSQAWKFLESLKDNFTVPIGSDFGQGVTLAQGLPHVVGLVFCLASGRGSIEGDVQIAKSESSLHSAAGTLRNFLEDGQGRVVGGDESVPAPQNETNSQEKGRGEGDN